MPGSASAESAAAVDALGIVASRGELGIDEYLNLNGWPRRHGTSMASSPRSNSNSGRLTLREQLNSDPVPVEPVRRTTGNVPGGGGQ